MSEIRIRRMSQEDVPEVAALGRQIFSEPWTDRGFAYALDLEENIFLVAECLDGHIAGYCGLYALADEGEIVNVAVEEANRRQGIGRRMLRELLRLAVQQGVRKFYLEARVSNEAAITLYQQEGFVPTGIRRDFYRLPWEDALFMSLILNP